MNVKFLKIFLLCGLIQVLFQACESESPQTKKAIKEETTHTTFDTSIIVEHWKKIPKNLKGIDSLNAWNFIWENNILINKFYDFRECEDVEIIRKDLNGNGIDDFFITFNKSGSYLYQKNEEGEWKEIWEGYEDGSGAPKLTRMFDAWMINSRYFMSCSNCSNDGSVYTAIRKGAARDVFALSWSYNYDHERADSDYLIYEQCNGKIASILGSQLVVKYNIVFSELESKLIFLEDTTVQITYEWTGDTLLMREVDPIALEPYLLKWQEKLEETRDCFGYSMNEEVLLSYWDFKKDALLKLKENKKYQGAIKELELTYEKSWKKLIQDWSTKYSFASPL